MTGNGKHTTYKNGNDWGMDYYCFTHINLIHSLITNNHLDYLDLMSNMYTLG
jgi:hypothetical protein